MCLDKHACFMQMFIIIALIQNNEKCDMFLNQALGALLNLVCCDQGSIAHVFYFKFRVLNKSFALF